MDGYELAGQIAAAAAGRRPLLVAVTGYGQVSDREKSLAAGFDVYADASHTIIAACPRLTPPSFDGTARLVHN
jgi:CheY-like chemotaxis protein